MTSPLFSGEGLPGSNVECQPVWEEFENKHTWLTSGIKAVPNLAVRDGYTQSYMSAPSAEHTTRSRGYPTPITYRGLSSGNNAVHCDTTLQNACFSSPPARPPTAYPGRWSFRSLRPEAKVHSKVTMCQSLLVSSS